MANVMATHVQPQTDTAFNNAYQSFYDSLPEKDQMLFAPCASVDDIIQGLKKLSTLAKNKKKASILERISSFAGQLEPYFKVVDIMVQSNPKYVALVWGALRLIFQLASNFPAFLDKLLTLFSNLSATLLQHHEIERFCTICPMITTNLSSYLERFYVDLFQLFVAVVRVFTSKAQTLKRTPVLIGELLWRPFDTRFAQFEERFRYYRELIKLEIALILAQMACDTAKAVKLEHELNNKARRIIEKLESMSSRERTEKDRDRLESARQDIKVWISAPVYEETLHRAQRQREHKTNDWIFSKPKIVEWVTMDWEIFPGSGRKLGRNVLWIQGSPGCGKTTLASSVIQGFRNNMLLQSSKADVYYYFFSSQPGAKSTTESACRSILTQILHYRSHDNQMLEIMSFLRAARSDGSSVADSNQVIELLTLCLSYLGAILVFDGVDECDNQAELMIVLFGLSRQTPTKILLFSRPNVTGLTRTVLKRDRLIISERDTSEDIRRYLTNQINILIEDECFPPSMLTGDLIPHLLEGASGMFLWANLMIKYLSSPALTPGRRVQVVLKLTMPESLATMYQRIVQLMEESSEAQRKIGKAAIEWVLYSVHPLTLEELHEALVLETEGDPRSERDRFNDIEDLVSIATGGLVELSAAKMDSHDNRCAMRFIHMTVAEFFQETEQGAKHRLIPSASICHLRLCYHSLRRILIHFEEEASVILNTQDLTTSSPLTIYAIKSWMHHMEHAFKDLSPTEHLSDCKSFLKTLLSFITTPLTLTAWLVLYHRLHEPNDFSALQVHGNLLQWKISMQGLSAEIDHLSQILSELSEEIARLRSDWGEAIINNPAILWDEVPAFTKSIFLTGKPKTHVTSMVPNGLGNRPSSGSRALSILSKSGFIDNFGSATAVLSIWPSASFQKAWDAQEVILRDDCTGWIVHYEFWKHGQSSARVMETRIPLDDQEIWTQVRQSLCVRWNDPEISFPLAIGDNLQCFMILRTFFCLQPAKKVGEFSLKSAEVPMTFAPDIERYWTIQQRENSWTYTYDFRISADSHRIFFSDTIASTKQREVYLSHIAVFEVQFEKSLQISVVSFGKTDSLDLLHEIVFHPTARLVILAYHDGVKLWHYINDANNIEYLWKRQPRTWWNGNIKLSNCGRFVLVAGQSEEIPIPEYLLSQNIRKRMAGHNGPLQDDISVTIQKIGSTDVSPFRLQSGQAINSYGFEIFSQNKKPQMLLVDDDGEIALRLHNITTQEEQTLHLLSIPVWNRHQKSSTTIFAPENDTSDITIVMDRGLEKSYRYDKNSVDNFPLAIKCDTSAMSIRDSSGARTEDCDISPSKEPKRRRLDRDIV